MSDTLWVMLYWLAYMACVYLVLFRCNIFEILWIVWQSQFCNVVGTSSMTRGLPMRSGTAVVTRCCVTSSTSWPAGLSSSTSGTCHLNADKYVPRSSLTDASLTSVPRQNDLDCVGWAVKLQLSLTNCTHFLQVCGVLGVQSWQPCPLWEPSPSRPT